MSSRTLMTSSLAGCEPNWACASGAPSANAAPKRPTRLYLFMAIDISKEETRSLLVLACEVCAERRQIVVAELREAEERHGVQAAPHDRGDERGREVRALLELRGFRALVACTERLRARHRWHVRRPAHVLRPGGVLCGAALLE